MRRKPESGFEQYLRRVYRAVSGTRAEKKRETARRAKPFVRDSPRRNDVV